MPEELINQIWTPSVELDDKNMRANVNTYTCKHGEDSCKFWKEGIVP